jgi:hypothetical protein
MDPHGTTQRASGPALIRAVRQGHGRGLRWLETQDPKRFDRSRWSRIERGLHGLSVDDLHAFAVVMELRELAKALRPYASAP